MCARLGLPENVQAKIIDKTLRAGEDGPDVCIWVTMALLSLAHRDAELMKKAGVSDTCGYDVAWAWRCFPLELQESTYEREVVFCCANISHVARQGWCRMCFGTVTPSSTNILVGLL